MLHLRVNNACRLECNNIRLELPKSPYKNTYKQTYEYIYLLLNMLLYCILSEFLFYATRPLHCGLWLLLVARNLFTYKNATIVIKIAKRI